MLPRTNNSKKSITFGEYSNTRIGVYNKLKSLGVKKGSKSRQDYELAKSHFQHLRPYMYERVIKIIAEYIGI